MTPTQARLAAERRARLDRMNQASLAHFDRCYDDAQKYLASLPKPKPPEPVIVIDSDPQDDFTWSRPMPLKVIMIQKAVAEQFGINRQMLLRRTNRRIIAFPRQVAMFMIHELLNVSYPQIGKFFGGRDHTTALYATNTIKQRLETDAGLALRVHTLRAALAHLRTRP